MDSSTEEQLNKKNKYATCKGGHIPAKLNAVEKHEVYNMVIERLMLGVPRAEIIPIIHSMVTEKISEDKAIRLYMEAKEVLENEIIDDAPHIMDVHIGWYEKLYQRFMDLDFQPGMNKCMKLKEKLIGLHRTDTSIVVNNKNVVNIVKNVQYDISKLSSEQQQRLQLLSAKMSKNAGSPKLQA